MAVYFRCEPCDKIFNHIHQHENHLESEKHKKKVNPALCLEKDSSEHDSDTSGLETDQYIQKYGTGYKCYACDVVMNSITTARSHAKGQKHLKTIKNNIPFSDSGIASCSKINSPLTLAAIDNLGISGIEISLHFIGVEDLLKEVKVIKANDPIEF